LQKWVHDPFNFPKDPKTGEPCEARLFDSDFAEFFSHTYWFMVPLIWVPVAVFGLCLPAVMAGTDLVLLGILTGVGVLTWWCIEYGLHRAVFHADENLPDSKWLLTTHFLLHGVHHKVPMDRYRLVMPPIMLAVLALAMYPVVGGLFYFLPLVQFHFVYGVAMLGYVCYDVFHYAFHFINVESLPDVLAYNLVFLKKHHMKHHYGGDANVGYGITTVFLDRVFGTELKVFMPKNWRTTAPAKAHAPSKTE
jgi:4-hydroxysphinganine ceramide fatty acyl 2-hydroxylase